MEWIKYRDKKPKDGTEVLFVRDTIIKEVSLGVFYKDPEGAFIEDLVDHEDYMDILVWMPKPEYKED